MGWCCCNGDGVRGGLAHHIIEDLMYLLGKAVAEALGDRRGIRRFGWSVVPMDETLVLTSVDLGQVYSSVGFSLQGQVEGVDVSDLAHGRIPRERVGTTVHLLVLRRGDPHHVVAREEVTLFCSGITCTNV